MLTHHSHKKNTGFLIICFLLIFTPLARAGVHLWAQTIVQTAALSGLFILIAQRIIRRDALVQKNTLDAPLAAIGLLVLAAALGSDYPSLAAEGAGLFFTYTAVYYLGVNFITTRQEQRITVYTIAGTAVFISVIALLKQFEINPFPFWEYKDLTSNTFLTGTYGNRNHFAGYLEMAIPMVLCLLFTRNRPLPTKMLIIAVAGILLMILTFTVSRGGWISTFSALLFMAGVSLKKNYGNPFFIRTLFFLILALILILITTPAFQRMAPLIQANRSDHVGFRLKVWNSSLDLIKDHPVTGTGPGTFGQAFPRYNPAGFDVLPINAHNDYIQFTAETGLMFLPLGLWLVYRFFCTGFVKLRSKSRQTRGMTLGAMTSVFGLLVHTAVDFNLHIPANALVFTLLCAMVCAKPDRAGIELTVTRKPGAGQAIKKTSRILILTGLTAVFLLCIIFQGFSLMSRWHYRQGIVFYKTGRYDKALDSFVRANRILDARIFTISAPRDRFRVHTAMGKTYYHLARKAKTTREFYDVLTKGAKAVDKAIDHDGGSYRTTFWAAKIHTGLETVWPVLFKTQKKNPFNALPLYEKAVVLNPAGHRIRYDMIKYLYHRGDRDKIPNLVKHMVSVYPLSINQLEKEPFYSDHIREKIKQGLLKALSNHSHPRITLFYLSRMAMEEDDVDRASAYYRQGLAHQPHLNTDATMIHMGGLLVKQGAYKDADRFFIKALQANEDFKTVLKQIYSVFKADSRYEEFVKFCSKVQNTLYASPYIDFMVAVSHMDSGKLEPAKNLLNRLNEGGDDAGVYDLLAQVHQKQSHWSAMEIAAQKATTLAPGNPVYWIRLSTSLAAQTKYSQAEAAATKAIALSTPPVFWYFGQRAGIRKEMGRGRAALADWKTAVKIKPDHANYHYAIALSYQALGKPGQALTAIDQAIGLKPGNLAYRSFKKELLMPR